MSGESHLPQISFSANVLSPFSVARARKSRAAKTSGVTTYSILLHENASKISRPIVVLNNLKCLFCESRAGRLNGPSDCWDTFIYR